ncbi:FAD-dependent oxidoreductase [Anaerorudis cellulosivorans]|uniref:FAD-dependent oxidoreductase n=1 Tax=Anaerorudis cellulosivorans TaxID=3397862 RepID=UPI002220E3BC|nr:FAD-dependent oxidoreductase [Seramator thermalis]MCW1736036.1 FAD-dependent oxidoreductase [Seramator thermalis]
MKRGFVFRYLRVFFVFSFLAFLIQGCQKKESHRHKADVIIYGGTSAAVIAAVEATHSGKSVIMVSPDIHLGGLSSGGLGWTDTGRKETIGGLARNFYHRIYEHYQKDAAWKWMKKEEFGNRGQGAPAIDGQERTMWIFEPHVAESVFEELITENNITVFRDEFLDRENGVRKLEGKIVSITTLSGKTFEGKMFIDATYEGDLMATSGVSYHVGREGNDVYGETWNGIQTGVYHHRHHFNVLDEPIDPYRIPDDPASGLLPRISPDPPGKKGEGDHRVQAYCFRVCMTDHPENRRPFPKPEGYDSIQYELLVRIFDSGWREWFDKFDAIPNRKTDTNNHGPFSSDNIGMNYEYPEADYERRKAIIKEHEIYQKGLYWFVANDSRVPQEIRNRMQQWGLAKDEFTDNGNWPHQLYVREARRMIGEFVMTENELMKRTPTPESVGMGSYTIDSHNVQRYVDEEGHVQNEGDIGVELPEPYEIAYGSLVPKKEECSNLLVPVCVSASHIAYGSIRMEPVFMILGQSAAAAACLSIDEKTAVQDVSYEKLRELLIEKGQVLTINDLMGKK